VKVVDLARKMLGKCGHLWAQLELKFGGLLALGFSLDWGTWKLRRMNSGSNM